MWTSTTSRNLLSSETADSDQDNLRKTLLLVASLSQTVNRPDCTWFNANYCYLTFRILVANRKSLNILSLRNSRDRKMSESIRVVWTLFLWHPEWDNEILNAEHRIKNQECLVYLRILRFRLATYASLCQRHCLHWRWWSEHVTDPRESSIEPRNLFVTC